MRFSLISTELPCPTARLGVLEFLESTINGVKGSLSTPAFILCTKIGSVPHLTRETLGYLDDINYWIQGSSPPSLLIPFGHFGSNRDVLDQFKKGIGKFIGLPSNPTLIAPMDPTVPTKLGYNQAKTLSFWNPSNDKFIVSPKDYMDGIRAMKPNMSVLLCDGETPENCSTKRILKASSKTLSFVESCLEIIQENPEAYENIGFFIPLEGGFDLKTRLYYVKEILKVDKKCQGYFFDGFHANGPLNDFNFETVKELIHETIRLLPVDKPKMIHGAYNPYQIAELANMGIDLFDSSYPVLCVDRGLALVFDYTDEEEIIESKKSKLEFYIDLKDLIYAKDFTPIARGCECYACQRHTKSYIHHLLNVNELLGGILLTMHNLHRYRRFFEEIRKSIEHNSLGELISKLSMYNKEGNLTP